MQFELPMLEIATEAFDESPTATRAAASTVLCAGCFPAEGRFQWVSAI